MKIRAARYEDAFAIAQVRVESWRTTYRGLLPEDYLQGLSIEKNARNWQGLLLDTGAGSYAYVAERDDNQIVGFVLGGPERTANLHYRGEVYALYLLQSYQGLGLGGALFRTCALRLEQAGYASLLVWCLKGNPSEGFYRALGGKPLGEKPLSIADGLYTEVAFGWSDIQTLTQPAHSP